MKLTWNFPVALLAALMLGLGAQLLPAHATNQELDFVLANRTGYAVQGIYIASSSCTDWGDNLLVKPMASGDQLAITFDAKAHGAQWDIRIVWVNANGETVWKKCRLDEISKFTLRYNPETDVTSAETE